MKSQREIDMMKKLIGVILFSISAVALADTYQVNVGFTDGTTYLSGEVPSYLVKYRVNSGAETILAASPTTGRTFTVTATPGQPIDVAAQTCNGALCSAYSAWVTATASFPPTTPQIPGSITITVTRTGS
jgi:hypothetical protein